MDEGRLLGCGISFPPRLGPDGHWAWSAGPANVREMVRVILMTNARERLMLPDFGGSLGEFLFEPNTVTTRHRIADRISRILAAWEPRLRIESVVVEEDAGDPQAAVATITYKLVATGVRERVAVTVPVQG
jgi:phage baseplate assembly protein W